MREILEYLLAYGKQPIEYMCVENGSVIIYNGKSSASVEGYTVKEVAESLIELGLEFSVIYKKTYTEFYL